MHVEQGAVHTVHPPAAADLKNPESHTHVLVAVIGNRSTQVRQFVAEFTQVAHGEVQAGHEEPAR